MLHSHTASQCMNGYLWFSQRKSIVSEYSCEKSFCSEKNSLLWVCVSLVPEQHSEQSLSPLSPSPAQPMQIVQSRTEETLDIVIF